MSKVLAINGSYRKDGVTDQILDAFVRAAKVAGVEIEIIFLRDYPIEFCTNCRECTQQPGENPGRCIFQDGMTKLVDKIEHADAYILASPTNFYSVTAVYKRFMERLVVYAFWPWGMNAPKYRKASATQKKAIIVSSCAAPAFLGRLVYGTHRQLKITAETIGAKTVGTLFTGLISKESSPDLSEKTQRKVQSLIGKIL
jgi:multimeric flavodoxin WrbA